MLRSRRLCAAIRQDATFGAGASTHAPTIEAPSRSSHVTTAAWLVASAWPTFRQQKNPSAREQRQPPNKCGVARGGSGEGMIF